MRIAIGCDTSAFELKEAIKAKLAAEGYDMLDLGCGPGELREYPEAGHAVGNAVASGEAEKGIAICGSGLGISISANKVPGIRAGLCRSVWDAETIKGNLDANVLCMGANVTGKDLAFEITDAWLNTEDRGGDHVKRRSRIEDIQSV